MAESVSVVEEGHASSTLPNGFEFSLHISTDNVKLASQVVGAVTTPSVTTLAALFRGNSTRSLIKTAVQNGFDSECNDQKVTELFPSSIQPGSLNVLLKCSTSKGFLEILADYESGRMEERLQEELSRVGIKVEGLKVEIENMAEVSETKRKNERGERNEGKNERNLLEDVENPDGENMRDDETVMKSLPCNEDAFLEEATSLGVLEPKPNLEKPRAKLLHCIYSSQKIERSINHVSILLIGISGVGKSSTVNHLLGVDLAKVSKTKSKTRTTKEYVVHGSDPKYGVEGLSLGLIDTPGFCDTDGSKQDACNLLSIQKFFLTHTTLSKCYPNLIFLLVKATDNRIVGENSDLGKALRCIKQLCLVDPKNPNVVVILTHVCSIRKKNDKEWIKELEEIKSTVSKIVFNDLKVHAPVVLIENKYEDCELTSIGDYTGLPNGEWQPKNLYTACANLLQTNKDKLGLITFNSIFKQAKNKDRRIIHGHKFEAKNAEKKKLDDEEATLVDFLKSAEEGDSKDPFYSAISDYINEQNLKGQNAEEVMKIAGVLRHLGKGDPPNFGSHSIHSIEYFLDKEISLIGREMLRKKFNINMKPSWIDLESGRLIGQGYNIITDKSVAAQAMNFEIKAKHGISIPSCAKFEKVLESTSFMEVLKDDKSYTKSRLRSLNVNLYVKPDIYKMGCRPGYNKKNESSSSSSTSEYSFLFEQRLFELKIGNYKEHKDHGMTFTKDFESAVKELPITYDESDPSCVSKFERFFDRFGHFLVSSAYGGGSVEVKCSRKAVGSTKKSVAKVKACLEATLQGSNVAEGKLSADGSNSEGQKSKSLLDQSTYSWKGGDVDLQTNDSIGDKEGFQKWKDSLLQNPTMLTTELTLEPISTAVGCVDPSKDQVTFDALKNLLQSDIKIGEEKNGFLKYLSEILEKVHGAFSRAKTIMEPYIP